MDILAVILAAGQGKRMKSKLYKVLHPLCGKPLVGHVMDTLDQLSVKRKIVVVGHGADEVQAYLGKRAEYVMQDLQLGTGHAVLQAKDLIGNEEGLTVVICGDTPLVREVTLQKMIELHQSSGAAATLLTAVMDNPFGYGRIMRSDYGTITKIVEQKDCSEEEAKVLEINTGTYCFDNRKLFEALASVTNDNVQQEYYLTDVIGILNEQGNIVQGFCTDDYAECVGINDRVQLAEAEKLLRERINREHMLNGVTIIDPAQTYIDKEVQIGADTVILPGTILLGNTKIGIDCKIGPNTEMTDSLIGNNTVVKKSVLWEATVGDGTTVGPFAYLRPGTKVGDKVKIGNFVELKNTVLGDGSKVPHLSYVGDAIVGTNVNFGCGAITVNYDGYNKNLTEVGDDAFIGSNVNLIAPVKIGKRAYVVAGSTITDDVEEDDLAIARQRQTNKPSYAEILRSRKKSKKGQE